MIPHYCFVCFRLGQIFLKKNLSRMEKNLLKKDELDLKKKNRPWQLGLFSIDSGSVVSLLF